jgi:hypothetical protein
MKKIVAVLTCILSLSGDYAFGQQEEAVSLKDAMLSMKRRKIVLNYLDLSEAEKTAFWPLYDEYYNEINPIETESLLLLRLCAGNDLSERDLEKYSKRLLLNDLVLAKIRKQYYGKFKAGLSGLRASQFMQFDDSFRMMLRYQAQQPQTQTGFSASVSNGIPSLKNPVSN